MTSNDTADEERLKRALIRSSAQRKEQLLRELQATQDQERVRLQEADAAKTARLRALRLAKEAGDAAPPGSPVKGGRVPS